MLHFKRIASVILCGLILLSVLAGLTANAAEVKNEKTYKPLDLVVVVDSSGSMNTSDKSKTALAAVKMLVNMMPAADSRVGIINFSRTATVLTKDEKGNDALLGLDSLTNVVTIRKDVSDVTYRGGTGIGNAVYTATELLEANKSDDRAQAIILFTDGVNDFENDAIALSNCEENEASALLWAKQNNCPIYCVGYDYITSDGISSMGVNGEGLSKLQNIASATQGKFSSISSIKEIEQLLIEFLADVCDLNYTTVATIPGDGGKHECPITVSPSVIEANIRIAGGDENSIANGKIQLYDPSGNEIKLENSGSVRFDADATAASIKVTMPTPGEWTLVVDGVTGDDIQIGLLEHFKMNLTSCITLPNGNPDGIAYSNDEIKIKTWLTYDGQNLDDEAIYNAVKSAKAICVPRADPENKKTVALERDGLSFVGSFIIPQDCYYDITIRLDWDTVYREDTLEIQSSNKPLYLKSEVPNVKVNKNKTAIVSDIYQYVADDEKDAITANVVSLSSPDTANVTINGNDLVVEGKKMSSSLVTLSFKDAQGNTVETTLKVKVNDPLVWITLALIVLLGAAAAVVLVYASYAKSLKVKGILYLTDIEFSEDNDDFDNDAVSIEFMNDESYDELELNQNPMSISMESIYRRKKNRNIAELISATLELFKVYELGTAQSDAKAILLNPNAKKLMIGAEKAKIIGSSNGASFTVKNNKKAQYLTVNRSEKKATVSSRSKLEICFKPKSSNRTYLKLHYYFISNVRSSRKKKK